MRLFDSFPSSERPKIAALPKPSTNARTVPLTAPLFSSLFSPLATPTRTQDVARGGQPANSPPPSSPFPLVPSSTRHTLPRHDTAIISPFAISSRKAKAGCAIAPSPFRPRVRASDRIHAWTTPYSLAKREQIASDISPLAVGWIDGIVSEAIVTKTKSSYAAGLLRFNQFCDSINIAESARMPASEYLIVAFIGFHKAKVGGACVKNWLSGLHAWHDMNGAPWPENSRLIRYARAGARSAGAHLKCARRNPITIHHMLALFFALDFSIPFHCAIWAVACMAFWGCRRLGELTIPSRSTFDPKFHVSRDTLVSFASHPNGSPKSVHFRIPWTKTTRDLGAPITGTAQLGELKMFCPFTAMRKHLHANARVPNSFSLFAYIDDCGNPQHMVKSSFLSFCHKIWDGKGLLKVHGHSFRIGGAVELLIAGVTPEIVAAIGGWTSLAFLIYWRRFEDILPTHVLKAYTLDQIARLKSTLDDFQTANNIPDSVIDICVNGIDIEDSL